MKISGQGRLRHEVTSSLIPRSSFLRRVLRGAQDFCRWDEYSRRSWSQFGEDLLVAKLFAGRKSGTYVDIGAHHPKRFSNTQYFYERGWNGINIDAMPGSMVAFRRSRRRDINLEIGIGASEGTLKYYVFNEPALNGFSPHKSLRRDHDDSEYKVVDVVNVPVLPLATVLKGRGLGSRPIGFFMIDVEGMDLTVLKSNDWQLFRPQCVVTEILGRKLTEVEGDSVFRFMDKHRYELHAVCGVSAIFTSCE